jgi:adenosine deaminase
VELQVDPTSYARHLNGVEPAVEVMLAACQDAAQVTGIGIVLVLTVSWGASSQWAHGSRHDTFVPAARIARDAGLLVVPHAGFYTNHNHVRRCVTPCSSSSEPTD